MRSYPSISVVIPCLNRAHYLVETIESVLQQDYPDLECVVVDGGSRDGTVELLRSYGDRVRWISEPDEGHADAINKGWRMARGEILAWLNADDLWEVPGAARTAAEYFASHPEVDVLYGDCGFVDTDGRLVGMAQGHDWDLTYAIESCDHCIPQPASFIRRSILEKVGWLDTRIFTKDRELWPRIALQGRIEHIPQILAYARKDEGLSQAGRPTSAAVIEAIRKFYTLPGVPPELIRRKRRAMSSAYVSAMDYAFLGGRHWDLVFRYAALAILSDPTNALRPYRFLHGYTEIGAADDWRIAAAHLALKSVRLPQILWRGLQTWRRSRRPARTPNLEGVREVEQSWAAAKMPKGPGESLDLAPSSLLPGLAAVERGFHVTAVGPSPVEGTGAHARLHFVEGEICQLPLPEAHYDLAVCCSGAEGSGLTSLSRSATRNGVEEEPELGVMTRVRGLLRPGGVLLLTLPVGRDGVIGSGRRVYGRRGLAKMMQGFEILAETFWTKDAANRWIDCSRETAVTVTAEGDPSYPRQAFHALGGFVLSRNGRR